jgi:hypothetical protein
MPLAWGLELKKPKVKTAQARVRFSFGPLGLQARGGHNREKTSRRIMHLCIEVAIVEPPASAGIMRESNIKH